jgi:hypothetical protein
MGPACFHGYGKPHPPDGGFQGGYWRKYVSTANTRR